MAKNSTPSPRTAEDRSALIAVTIFPLLIIGAAVWAFFWPSAAGNLTPHISTLLGIIMFGMGLTLTIPDFKLVLTRPLPILLGVVAQYVIMPGLAWLIVTIMDLPDGLAIGVILVGCAPGGTSSNVISYLAKADVALSVTMTSVSTLLAPIMTPLLVQFLAGTTFELDAGAMAIDIVKAVLLPVLAGLVIRLLIPKVIDKILPILPWISTFGIAGVVAGVVPGNVENIKTAGLLVLGAVVAHNLLGYLLGYWVTRLFKFDKRTARTVSIEAGMQNSGLATTLAHTHFPATPEAALPGAVFSVWHNLSGAFLSLIYRSGAERDAAREIAATEAATSPDETDPATDA